VKRSLYAVLVCFGLVLSAGLSWIAYQRFIVGRASPEACGPEAAVGVENIPANAFALLDEYAGGTHTETRFSTDGRITQNAKIWQASSDDMERLKRDVAASGVYELGSGCYVGYTPTAPSDESASHLWLVTNGTGYEYAWRSGHRRPAVLEKVVWRLRLTRDLAIQRPTGR
jgi:hypothetical protein